MTEPGSLDQARAASRAGDAARARALLADADDPRVREAPGSAAYLDLDFAAASAQRQRAYAGFRAADDRLGAVRAARSLAPQYGMVCGDSAVMSGWRRHRPRWSSFSPLCRATRMR